MIPILRRHILIRLQEFLFGREPACRGLLGQPRHCGSLPVSGSSVRAATPLLKGYLSVGVLSGHLSPIGQVYMPVGSCQDSHAFVEGYLSGEVLVGQPRPLWKVSCQWGPVRTSTPPVEGYLPVGFLWGQQRPLWMVSCQWGPIRTATTLLPASGGSVRAATPFCGRLPANGGPVRAATPPLKVSSPNAEVNKSSFKVLKAVVQN